jgi:hypothetical protein
MEKLPGSSPNKAEESPERILSSEEVLAAISEHAEGYTLSRELSDEKGVYLREVEVAGDKEGEVTEYQYMRKGTHANHNESDQTAISVIYYQDGVPVGGQRIATFNDETGEWKRL